MFFESNSQNCPKDLKELFGDTIEEILTSQVSKGMNEFMDINKNTVKEMDRNELRDAEVDCGMIGEQAYFLNGYYDPSYIPSVIDDKVQEKYEDIYELMLQDFYRDHEDELNAIGIMSWNDIDYGTIENEDPDLASEFDDFQSKYIDFAVISKMMIGYSGDDNTVNFELSYYWIDTNDMRTVINYYYAEYLDGISDSYKLQKGETLENLAKSKSFQRKIKEVQRKFEKFSA